MNLRALAVFLWVCLMATAAVAGEEHRTHIKVVVDSDGKDQKTFEFDSDKSNIDLHGMAVGESQEITDDNGKEVTVLRTESGFEFDVDGEKIKVMDFDDCDESDGDKKHVKRKVRVIKKEVDVTN